MIGDGGRERVTMGCGWGVFFGLMTCAWEVPVTSSKNNHGGVGRLLEESGWRWQKSGVVVLDVMNIGMFGM